MKYKVLAIILSSIIMITIIPTSIASFSQNNDNDLDGPHVDFLFGAGILGFNIVIWNYGTQPAHFIRWEVEIQGVNGTRVIGGHRRGMIPILRPKDTQYMAPLTLPKTKYLFPFGYGEVEITVRVSCRNADFNNETTSNWILNGFVLRTAFYH